MANNKDYTIYVDYAIISSLNNVLKGKHTNLEMAKQLTNIRYSLLTGKFRDDKHVLNIADKLGVICWDDTSDDSIDMMRKKIKNVISFINARINHLVWPDSASDKMPNKHRYSDTVTKIDNYLKDDKKWGL